MGDGIGKGLQFLVGGFKLCGAFANPLLKLLVQSSYLFFRMLSFGDVDSKGSNASLGPGNSASARNTETPGTVPPEIFLLVWRTCASFAHLLKPSRGSIVAMVARHWLTGRAHPADDGHVQYPFTQSPASRPCV